MDVRALAQLSVALKRDATNKGWEVHERRKSNKKRGKAQIKTKLNRQSDYAR